jgi:ketosteroid isomerase-like protein
MSRENIEVAREVLSTVERRDVSRLIELTDPEIEWHSFFAALLEGGKYQGHDGIRRYITDLEEAWETLRADADGEMLDVGDLVICVGRIHYRGKTSSVETEAAAGWVFKFRNRRLLRFRAFSNPELALEAVGLQE